MKAFPFLLLEKERYSQRKMVVHQQEEKNKKDRFDCEILLNKTTLHNRIKLLYS